MVKAISLFAAVLALAVPAGATAAAKPRILSTSGVMKGEVGPPSQGSASMTYAAITRDRRYGTGALIARFINSNNTLVGTFVHYRDTGTVRGSFAFRATPTDSGGAMITGNYAILGGTKEFRGAKGRGTVHGTDDGAGGVILEFGESLALPRR